jgi:hypothetical protein
MTLTGGSLSTSVTTTTDANGYYAFSGLASGTYTLTPTFSTTQVVCKGISLPQGMTVTINYTFSPGSLAIPIDGSNSTDGNFVGTAVPWRGSCPV